MDRQQTISRSTTCAGVGLHTGAWVTMTLRPADVGEGVAFVRADVKGVDVRIPASALNVSTTQLGTNLTNRAGVSVATVEHFLAAASGVGIDNLIVELDGPEAPILDGSAAPFVELLLAAGLAGQAAPRRRLKVLKSIEVRDGVKYVRLTPSSGERAGLTLDLGIDFPSRAIGRQRIRFELEPGAFAREVAYARTFGFARDVEKLRSLGLARGGSMDNAIVVDGDTVLNPDGLRVADEFVRHKLIDAIGDLYLAGGPIDGVYVGEQPGHALNNRLLRQLLADPDAFVWLT